jgi:hypothetical protein
MNLLVQTLRVPAPLNLVHASNPPSKAAAIAGVKEYHHDRGVNTDSRPVNADYRPRLRRPVRAQLQRAYSRDLLAMVAQSEAVPPEVLAKLQLAPLG